MDTGLDASSEPTTVALGSNPFLAPVSGDGVVYKKGYIMRKCCTDPNGKKSKQSRVFWLPDKSYG